MLKKFRTLLFLFSFCALVGKGLYWTRNGFNICKVREPMHEQFEFWNPEADQALFQKYRFLGRGRQCFAFESDDGKYVLKLPRTDIYQIPLWLRFLPLHKLRERQKNERSQREHFILESFRIAYEELSEQTGTFALHVGCTGSKKDRKITLVDSSGFSFQLPFDRTTFVLQYKHPILMKSFLAAKERGDRVEAEKILSAFIDVVIDRGKKGIWNRDESFLRNYGFDGKNAFQIDIGSFYHKSNGIASIHDTMHPVRSWLAKTDGSYLFFFDKELEAKLH